MATTKTTASYRRALVIFATLALVCCLAFARLWQGEGAVVAGPSPAQTSATPKPAVGFPGPPSPKWEPARKYEVEYTIESEGQRIVLHKVVGCYYFSGGMGEGAGGGSGGFRRPHATTGQRLPSGAAVMAYIPDICMEIEAEIGRMIYCGETPQPETTRCKRDPAQPTYCLKSDKWNQRSCSTNTRYLKGYVRGPHGFQRPGIVEMPLIMWTDDPDNFTHVYVYASTLAYQNPQAKLKLVDWYIGPLREPDRPVDQADEFAYYQPWLSNNFYKGGTKCRDGKRCPHTYEWGLEPMLTGMKPDDGNPLSELAKTGKIYTIKKQDIVKPQYWGLTARQMKDKYGDNVETYYYKFNSPSYSDDPGRVGSIIGFSVADKEHDRFIPFVLDSENNFRLRKDLQGFIIFGRIQNDPYLDRWGRSQAYEEAPFIIDGYMVKNFSYLLMDSDIWIRRLSTSPW